MENQDEILVPGNMTIFSFAIALWQSSPKSLPKDSQKILEMVHWNKADSLILSTKIRHQQDPTKYFLFKNFFRKAFVRKKVFGDTKVTLEHEIRNPVQPCG